MTFILKSPGGEDLEVDLFSWHHLMELGRLYGWRPRATRFDHPFFGARFADLVTSEDARTWAEALAAALPDVSDMEIPEANRIDVDVSPLEWFAGPRKSLLAEFIALARRGEITVA